MPRTPVQTQEEKVATLQAMRKLTERELNLLGVSVLPPELQKGEAISDLNWLSLTIQELARVLQLPPDKTMSHLTEHAKSVMARLE